MYHMCLLICLVLGISLSTVAQGTIDKNGVYHPTEEEIAKSKRVAELLRHPTFIKLRLSSMSRYSLREEPSTTPSPYTVDEWINFELFITQNSAETLMFWSSVSPYYQYRPELVRDGDIVAYSKETQQNVEIAEKEPPSGSSGISISMSIPGCRRIGSRKISSSAAWSGWRGDVTSARAKVVSSKLRLT